MNKTGKPWKERMYFESHPSDVTKYADPKARQLIFARSEMAARFFLFDFAEAELFPSEEDWNKPGVHDGWCKLSHAEYYLADRVGYEMNPPPTPHSMKFQIKVSI